MTSSTCNWAESFWDSSQPDRKHQTLLQLHIRKDGMDTPRAQS